MSGAADSPLVEQDPYLLTSRQEILLLFRHIREHNLLIQMRGRQYAVSTVTALLDIAPDTGWLIVDRAPQEPVNQAMLADGKANFEVLVEQIKVQFVGQPLRAVLFEGQSALTLPLPQCVRRIQRRASFRAPVPASKPAMCTLAMQPQPLTLVLRDISAGGLCLVLPDLGVDLQVGTMVHNASLMLPDVGRMLVDLQIVRETEHELANGKRVRHIGMCFVGLRGQEETAIQHYILGLERMMIARKRGLA